VEAAPEDVVPDAELVLGGVPADLGAVVPDGVPVAAGAGFGDCETAGALDCGVCGSPEADFGSADCVCGHT